MQYVLRGGDSRLRIRTDTQRIATVRSPAAESFVDPADTEPSSDGGMEPKVGSSHSVGKL